MDYMTMNFNRNGGGTSDYSQLTNKPSINDVELVGNKTSADLGLMPAYEVDDTPTEDSDNLISSKAVYEADQSIENELQGAKTVSGNPITVTDAEPMNAESVVVELEPKQDLHGYDKPWVGGAGKNKVKSISDNPSTSQYATILYVDIDFEPSTTYTMSFEGTGGNHLYTNENLVVEPIFFEVESSGRTIVTFTTKDSLPSAEHISAGWAFLKNAENLSSPNTFNDVMIELGQTATSFEPYSNICPISGYSEVNVENNSTTYTVSLGGTKYGGVLDVTSGVLTVTHGIADINDFTFVSSGTSGGGLHRASYDGAGANQEGTSKCSMLERQDDAWFATSPCYSIIDGGLVVYCTESTESDFVGAYADLQICYELATPLTIQLTPTDITLLETTNNISTDGTNIELKYQPNNVIGECKAYTDEQVQKVLPTPPTTDGTYHLECSVSGGIPTISWVSNI